MPSTRERAQPLGREQAQHRVDQVHAFRAELAQLQADGILLLPLDQARAVRAHHDALLDDLKRHFDIDRTHAERQMSLGMRAASLIGAVALSAAVFLFFYRFWGALAVPVQVILLVAAPLVAAAAVEIAARYERTLYIASLLALVAFASFVLDLSVVGTIFNLTPSPWAFLPWALFAFLFAYAYRLRLMLVLALGCAGIWLAAVLVATTGVDWRIFPARPEGLVLAGGIALAAAGLEARRGNAGFAQVYRASGLLALLLPLVFLSEIDSLSYAPLSATAVRRFYDVAGFAAGVGALWLAVRREWMDAVNISGLFLVLFLCVKLHDWLWNLVPRYVFFLVVGAFAIGLIAVLQRLRARIKPREQ